MTGAWPDQRKDIAALWQAIAEKRVEDDSMTYWRCKDATRCRDITEASDRLGDEARHPTGKHWTPR